MSESAFSIVQKRLRWIGLVLAIILIGVILVSTKTGTISVAQEEVSFSKSVAPDTIGPGSVSTLQFVIVNANEVSPLAGLAFTDTLPAGVKIASPAVASVTCSGILDAPDGGDMISFRDGRVGPAGVCLISVDVTSSQPGTHTNVSGELTSDAGNHGTATDDLIVDLNRPGFTKSFSPSSIPPGGTSTLILTIDNTANAVPAFSISFVDVLPTGMVIANPSNASTDCTGALLTAEPGASIISFSYGSVGASSACTVSVDVVTSTTGQFGNITGELTSGTLTVVSSGKASAILDVTPDFLDKVFVDDPVPPGDTVTLEFTITNLDRADAATNISFSDDLDATLTGLTAVGLPLDDPCGTGSQLTGSGVITLTGGNLPPEGSCTFGVTLQVPGAAASGTYANTTSAITADIGGEAVEGSAATDYLDVEPAPVLTKSFTDDPVVAGGTVTLAFTLANMDPDSTMSGIAFTDNLFAVIP